MRRSEALVCSVAFGVDRTEREPESAGDCGRSGDFGCLVLGFVSNFTAASLGWSRHGEHLFFIGIEGPVVDRMLRMVEDGDLPVEGADAAIDIDFSQPDTGVVDEITGGKVVASVDDQVIGSDEAVRIFGCEPVRIGLDMDFAVEPFQALPGLFCL